MAAPRSRPHSDAGDTRDAGPLWLRAVLQQMPSAVMVAQAPSGEIVFWNDRATRAWPDVLPAPAGVQPCRALRSDGAVYSAAAWPLARSLRTGAIVASEEVELCAPDGSRTVVDVRCVPVRDEGGAVTAVVAILHDVTERKLAERALAASQARYENLYQDAPDMFASIAIATERVVQCNDTLLRATGFARAEVLGRGVAELHVDASAGALAAALARVAETGRAREVDLGLRRRDGGVIDVSLSMALIRDEQDNLYYRAIWRDVSERTRAQAALDRKQAELARSRAELQALAGRLLGAQEDERRRIARELHDDVNQRLAMLTLDVESLLDPRTGAGPPDRLATLRDRLVALSDDVHGLAYRLHPSILDDLGLAAALRSLVADLTRRESMTVELIEDLRHPMPPEVAACLYRVTQEALHNVVKHARAGQVTVDVRSTNDAVTLTVDDAGIGFTTGDDAPHGLGLVGMAERVRLVGGRFRLDTRPGAGTRISVRVPLTEGAPR